MQQTLECYDSKQWLNLITITFVACIIEQDMDLPWRRNCHTAFWSFKLLESGKGEIPKSGPRGKDRRGFDLISDALTFGQFIALVPSGLEARALKIRAQITLPAVIYRFFVRPLARSSASSCAMSLCTSFSISLRLLIILAGYK
jgi:hypothetical protein